MGHPAVLWGGVARRGTGLSQDVVGYSANQRSLRRSLPSHLPQFPFYDAAVASSWGFRVLPFPPGRNWEWREDGEPGRAGLPLAVRTPVPLRR